MALVGLVIVGVGMALIIEGAVFALVGALIVYAAWTVDPDKASGLDGALRTLLHEPFGTVLVLIVRSQSRAASVRRPGHGPRCR